MGEPVKKAHPGASYADIFTLAGVVAIKEANGPVIGWSSGRVDEPVSSVAPDGRLPNADMGSPAKTADHLRDGVFYRMGFDDAQQRLLLFVIKRRVDAARLGRPTP